MVEPAIASPLLSSCRRGYVPVVLAVVYDPFSLVEPLLLLTDVHQMVYALLPSHAVDCEEVLESHRPLLAVTSKKIMLRFVAAFAEAFDAHQALIACLCIELPGLVAVHPALTTANLAAITGPAIDMAANTVPLAARQ